MCLADTVDMLKVQSESIDTALEAIMPFSKPRPAEQPLAVDVEIACTLSDPPSKKYWMTVDVYGTIRGEDTPATRDEPASGRYIDNIRIESLGINITDALPPEIVDGIEYRILFGDYA